VRTQKTSKSETKHLKNKPLVEAIFESRWDLQEISPGLIVDPHYKIIIGRIYERFKEEYSFHEQLPAAFLPDEIAGHIAQHRFRKEENRWPLIQIGPGILTVNDTEGYIWEDFEKRIIQAVEVLFAVYPDSTDNLKFNSVSLRYIDAVDFDFEKDDLFTFLRRDMKTNIDLYSGLFKDTGVDRLPIGFDWRFSFRSSSPKGAVHLRFVRGKRKEKDALRWETIVQSRPEDIPEIPKGLAEWLRGAHDLTHNWFFKLTEGELLKRFE